jgi:membrane-bound lytic murein transglycosylase D
MGNAHTKARARKRGTPGKDWRLAALSGSCSVLGSACLLLAACSGNPAKPTYTNTPATAVPDVAAVTPTATQPSPPEQAAPAADSATSPWVRLRRQFALSACDYNPAVSQWSRRFSRDAAGFSASLSQSMPFLLVVLEQIEQRKLPGEFAFLPYIESNYTALASSGDRSAGIWQLMPDTAREAGLHITREYDGRLDIYASTTAALDLLERYNEQFGDWRLADMAFNAGEYRIKDLRGGNTEAPTAAELTRLRVHAHTHEHLAKLLAASCIVADPERFHVELPDPQAGDELAALDLPAPVDLALIAHVAGIDRAALKHLNPGYLRGHMPEDGPYRLLLPAAQRDAVATTLDKVPRPLWREWHAIALQHEERVDVLASAYGLAAPALAAANTLDADATLPAGARLLVPGHADKGYIGASIAKVEDVVEKSSTHIVRAGDTLWSIAHGARVHLADLLRWNGLRADATLRLGQHLRLATQETAGSSATGVAAPN